MPPTLHRLLPVLAATLVTTIASAQNLVMPDNCNLIGPTITTAPARTAPAAEMRAAFLAHPRTRSEDRPRT